MKPAETPLHNAKIVETYSFYDAPRLFLCANPAGQHFLVTWADETDGRDAYLYSAVNECEIHIIRNGLIDLRDMFTDANDDAIYRVTDHWTDAAEVTELNGGELNIDELPMAGERLKPAEANPPDTSNNEWPLGL